MARSPDETRGSLSPYGRIFGLMVVTLVVQYLAMFTPLAEADQFVRYPKHTSPAANIHKDIVSDPQTCATACLKDAVCTGFNFGVYGGSNPSYCVLETDTNTSLLTTDENFDVYVRTSGNRDLNPPLPPPPPPPHHHHHHHHHQ